MPRAVKPMFVVQLIGGLGNQMFQYALGRALSLKFGVPLKLDISAYRTYRLHGYALSALRIVEDYASDEEVQMLRLAFEARPLVERLLRRIMPRRRWVRERGFGFDATVLETSPPAYLEGYWQSERYFKSCVEVLRREFQLRAKLDIANSEMGKRMSECESVALHVRRGDYVSDPTTNAVHGVCSMEYYEHAIALANARLVKPSFFIFSDDLAWAKDNLRTACPSEFVDINDPSRGYLDLHLMARCRHQIIANSTLSWWGAWLNPSATKMVIAPKRWFRRNDMDTRDLIPDGWLTI